MTCGELLKVLIFNKDKEIKFEMIHNLNVDPPSLTNSYEYLGGGRILVNDETVTIMIDQNI